MFEIAIKDTAENPINIIGITVCVSIYTKKGAFHFNESDYNNFMEKLQKAGEKAFKNKKEQ